MVNNCIFAHNAMCYHSIVYLHTMRVLQKHYFNYYNICNACFDHLHFRWHPFALKIKKKIIDQRNTQNKTKRSLNGKFNKFAMYLKKKFLIF